MNKLLAVLLAVAVFAAGIYLGGHPSSLPKPLQETLIDEQVALQAQVIDTIEKNYFKRVSRSKLGEAAVEGAVRKLGDRFTAYLNPEHTRLLNERREGQYSGVGLTVSVVKRGLKVESVVGRSPAKSQGIRAGDVIERVNGRSIAGETAAVASARIRGPEGTVVVLRVITPSTGKKRSIRLTRSKIELPMVSGKLVRFHGRRYAVVRLSEFGGGASVQLEREISRLRKRSKGLVLDLRGNPGGLVDESVDVVSLFLKRGVVVKTEGRVRPEETLRVSGEAPFVGMHMVVLVDGGTASAAEIVTGALMDHHRARVVGSRTFGKGVFQEIFPLFNSGSLDLTVGHYFTPKGRDLGGKGVRPDRTAVDRTSTKGDEALEVSLRLLASK